MLIIGSVALSHHTEVRDRKVMDLDAIVSLDEFSDMISEYTRSGNMVGIFQPTPTTCAIKFKHGTFEQSIHEYTIATPGDSNDLILQHSNGQKFASLDVLLMLKMSHRYKKNSPHFMKTMRDIHFLRECGAKVTDDLKSILKLREQETYTYSHPKLNQDKDNFFVKDESFYVWDHDDIHVAVKTLDKPAYLYFQPVESEVMTSKKMWNECSDDIKCRAGLEESYVLAIERSLVPSPGVLTVSKPLTRLWKRSAPVSLRDGSESIVGNTTVSSSQCTTMTLLRSLKLPRTLD